MIDIFDREQIFNICENCIDDEEEMPISYRSDEGLLYCSDTGFCDRCRKVGDVFDFSLLQIYEKFNLSPRVIHRKLPRLRKTRPNTTIPELTLEEAEILAQKIKSESI